MSISLLHRREGIIISTIEVLNEVGLQNLSTKLIAQKEGVSEGTLFRHYKNKTEIMIAVLDHFSQFDDAIIETSVNKKLSPLEAIKHFIAAYVEYYENYPSITALVQAYDTLVYDDELADKVRSIIKKRSNFILKIVDEAKNSGLIKKDIKSESIEDLITGATKEICLKWRLSKYEFSLKNRTLEALDMLLEAFIEKDK